MKTTLLTFAALSALLLGGCSKIDSTGNESQSQYIRATAEIEDGTAPTKGVLIGTDAISDIIFVHKQDVQGALNTFDFSGSAEITGVRATNGDITFSPVLEYDLAGDKTSYFMGYTSTGGILASDVFTWTLDGANDVLITDFWNGGRYSDPKTEGMVFRHHTARLQVVCKAESSSSLSVVQAMWGNIESIKLVDAMPQLTFTYATGEVAPSGTAADFTLLNADSYITGAFAAVAIPENSSAAITASAMLAPVASASISLKVKTVNLTEKTIPITLSGNFERAKIHKVILTFKANGRDIEVKTSTIEGWAEGTEGSNNVTEPTA